MRFALSQGEPAGCGLDICITIAANGAIPSGCEVVFIGSFASLKLRAQKLGIGLRAHKFNKSKQQNGLAIYDIATKDNAADGADCGHCDPASVPLTLKALEVGAQGCKDGLFDALVTLPVHKANINNSGVEFIGQTEFLGSLDKSEPVMVMATFEGMRVGLVTTHVPLKKVSGLITQKRVLKTLKILDWELRNRWKIHNPHIAICGLNPHAGEGGWLGKEEINKILPAMEKARDLDIGCSGPYSADSIFSPVATLQGGNYSQPDLILAMYHDQGLIPMKQKYFDKAVNVTCGLSFIRTSPDHGTALNIAGTGKVSIAPTLSALKVAKQLSQAKDIKKDHRAS